jgi:hypothetical protein
MCHADDPPDRMFSLSAKRILERYGAKSELKRCTVVGDRGICKPRTSKPDVHYEVSCNDARKVSKSLPQNVPRSWRVTFFPAGDFSNDHGTVRASFKRAQRRKQ